MSDAAPVVGRHRETGWRQTWRRRAGRGTGSTPAARQVGGAAAHGKRADIQGLRAAAVGLVVVAHLATYQLARPHHLAGGFIGVDVFFVLSGYLITSLLVREVDRTGTVSLPDFYARRARRILPAATVVLVAVLVATAVWAPAARMHQTVGDAWWSAIFFANWHFAHVGTSYFSTTALSPLQHYWSLSVEEQFYLVWPLAMLVVAPRVRRRTLAALVGAVLLVSLGWSVHSTLYAGAVSHDAAYFSTPARSYELALGALLAVAGVPRLPRWVRLVLGIGGLAALVAATLGFGPNAAFPGWEALVPTLATAALILSGHGSPTVLQRLLSLRPLTWLGDVSYSLYLWHFPIIVLAPFYLPASWSNGVRVPVELVLMLGFAAASYRLIEQPFLHRRVRLFSRRGALALWPAALALVLVGTTAASSWSGHEEHRQQAAAAQWWAAHSAQPATPTHLTVSHRTVSHLTVSHRTVRSAPVPDIAGELSNAVRLAEQGAPFPPGLDVAHLPSDGWQTTFHCYADQDQNLPPYPPTSASCVIGDRTATRTVAVVGDSHAGMWLPALDRIFAADHLRLVPYIKVSCSPYDVYQRSPLTPAATCAAFRTWTLRQLRALRPDAILVAARGELYVNPTAQSVDEQWRYGVSQTLSSFKRITPHLIVFGDVVGRGSQPADCLTHPGYAEADCLHSPISIETHSNAITAAVAQQLGATFVRTLPLTCTATQCPLVVGTDILYRDDSHLTSSWVLHLEPLLTQLLRAPLAALAGS